MSNYVRLASLGPGVVIQLSDVIVGRQIFIYLRGTTTQAPVYQDSELTTPESQPIFTDAYGSIPGYVVAGQALDAYDVLTGRRIEIEAAVGATPQTKRVTHVIGGEGNFPQAYTAGQVDGNFRQIVCLPVNTTRWRLRARNYQYETNTAYAGALQMTSCYVGTPDYLTSGYVPNARWSGYMKGVPQQAYGPLALPSDGSEWIAGAWVTAPSMQFEQGVPTAVSIGILSAAAMTVSADTKGLVFHGTGANGDAGNVAPPNGSGFTIGILSWLDWRLEYEYATTPGPGIVGPGGTPVVLAIGDSITAGYTNAGINAQEAIAPHEGWFGCASVHSGFAGADIAIGGSTLAQWATQAALLPSSSPWFGRADVATTVPDYAVIALGNNDIDPAVGNDTTLATLEGYFATIISGLYGLGIQRVIACTVVPEGWSGANETARLAFNAWLSELPFGLIGVWDHDHALYLPQTPASADPVFIPSGVLHPTLTGHRRMASISRLPRYF